MPAKVLVLFLLLFMGIGLAMIKNLFIVMASTTFSWVAYAQDHSSYYSSDYQQDALDIYRHRISVRSAAGHGKVPEVANYLADLLREGGFDAKDIRVIPQILSMAEETASLVVPYRGNGASGRKPILLLTHMDVVDALPQDWERDPFMFVEEDGLFFGRGSLDDKYGITKLKTTFLRLIERRIHSERKNPSGFGTP